MNEKPNERANPGNATSSNFTKYPQFGLFPTYPIRYLDQFDVDNMAASGFVLACLFLCAVVGLSRAAERELPSKGEGGKEWKVGGKEEEGRRLLSVCGC